MKNIKQLTLNLGLKDDANFTNFIVGNNVQLVEMLSKLHAKNSPVLIYLWGKTGVGKSHLLSALCQLFTDYGLLPLYLPFEDAKQIDPKILDDLEKLDILCIDDLNLIAGNLVWEEQIFHCFNKMMASGKKMVITADVAPSHLKLQLTDLKSRMMGSLVFTVRELDDEGKVAGLKLRAKLRGLELHDHVAHFLLSHYKRDARNLFVALEKLDRASLAAQRKLTIPFVKNVLSLKL